MTDIEGKIKVKKEFIEEKKTATKMLHRNWVCMTLEYSLVLG